MAITTPAAIQDFARGDLDAEVAGVEAERVEPPDQSGLGHDPSTPTSKLALDALEDVDLPATSRKHQGGQKPTHRPADDQGAALGAALRHANTCYLL